jgi:nucleoid-associated protein YgaU
MTQRVPQLPVLSDDIVIEDEPIAFDDPFKNVDFSTPVVKPIEMRPKPTAANVSVGQGANTYTVQRGDTISQIVANYNKNNPNANLK